MTRRTRPRARPRARPRPRAGRLAAAVLTALLLLLPAACVSLPESGPVVQTDASRDTGQGTGFTFDPLPPQPDASPAEVVKGFLDAMTAVPIQTSSAAQFLTQEARTTWRPQQRTITYGATTAPVGTSRVTVQVSEGGNRFDARGAWLGPLRGEQRELSFIMQQDEQGQYRIARPPDALIVPESWFEARFERLSLHFFDPAARVLVPEPVFVVDDDALATRLVEGLLEGPRGGAGGSRTFFPTGTRKELSVPVSDDGVASVSLIDVGRQTPESMSLMVVQLAATLRQVPGLDALRVSVDGQPLVLPAGDDGRFPIDLGAEYDAAVPHANAAVFGLRDGLLVAGIPEAMDAVGGPFGTAAQGLRSIAVNLDGDTAAGVSEDGTSLLLGPVYDDRGVAREVLADATDLLEPSWDHAGRLWLVDRGRRDARVYHRRDGATEELRVRGITGTDVRALAVSRDGSRLVAVVRRSGRDEIVVSRVLHGDQGEVLRATGATSILGGTGEPQRIRDIAWQTPVTVAALVQVTAELWEVRTVAVDGAPTSQDSVATLNGPVRSLAGSPVPGQDLVVLTRDEAISVAESVTGRVPVQAGQQTLGYAG
ncbi:LpqB family beta-propeller domain-containing protein [Nocardioides dongkuii]|uniref:LpqB family beta-propeller domain-containing protein n=1 Tax=Nocardioides dongkuii TaxID=2760089 RepID=UPI0018780BF7|nr:LpqB family beta-propeller domain-containing protein [Nocardioides dongkuii]